MPTTYYHTVNGRIRGESTAGVRTDYLTDALGSVVTTVNSSAQVVNTYRYKPYGERLAKTGVGADPRFGWTGDTGSRRTDRSFSEHYNMLRHYGVSCAQWNHRDLIWPYQPPYGYASENPVTYIDPSGLLVEPAPVPVLGGGDLVYFKACAFIGLKRSAFLFPGWLRLLFFPFLGLNTNSRDFFGPLDCKMLVQVAMPSCGIGTSTPIPSGTLSRSQVAILQLPAPIVIFTADGDLEIQVVDSGITKCNSYVSFKARGYGGLPGNFVLRDPIKLDAHVWFTAGPDTVRVTYAVSNKTRFPDWEFHLQVGGSLTMLGIESPFSGPEIGLKYTDSGPVDTLQGPAPTRSCCGGSCP